MRLQGQWQCLDRLHNVDIVGKVTSLSNLWTHGDRTVGVKNFILLPLLVIQIGISGHKAVFELLEVRDIFELFNLDQNSMCTRMEHFFRSIARLAHSSDLLMVVPCYS